MVNQAQLGSGGFSAITVTSSASPTYYTVPVTFTANLPSQATGTITFMDGSNTLGTSPISAGAATWTTSVLSVGVHADITAVYSGDSNFQGATSAPISQTINAADSMTLLTINSSPASLGASVQLSALVTAGGTAPSSSTVTFYDGATQIGTGSVTPANTTNLLLYSNNLAGVAWTPSNATVTASGIQGPTTNTVAGSFTSTAASGYVSQTVNGLTASSPAVLSSWLRVASGSQTVPLTVTDTSNNVLSTQNCTLNTSWSRCSVSVATGPTMTSVIAQIGGVANGVTVQVWGVQLEEGSTAGPYVQTDGVSLAGSGATASMTISTLDAGTHSITASYPGDPNVAASTSAAGALVINKAASGAETVTVLSGTNPSTYKGNVTFTISVAAIAGNTPTGTITLLDGATQIGTGSLSGGSVQIGTAILTAGSHSITAQYSGDSNYSSATSSILTQTVNQAAGTLSLATDGSPSNFGATVHFTATVPSDATGTVSFTDNGTGIGTATISAGTAVLAINALTAGSHTVAASWPGDSNYSAPANATTTQVVNKILATVSVSGSPNPSVYGGSVVMTVVLTGVNGVTPTGTVSIADGATVLNASVPITSGTATFTTSALAAGAHTITVTYNGDSNYN
jgi:hypothetical protein